MTSEQITRHKFLGVSAAAIAGGMLAACTIQPAAPAEPTPTTAPPVTGPTAWNLTGELVETCSCNMLCPCWFGVKELMVMDQGWCAGPQLYRIQNGQSAGVDLSGQLLVVTPFFPGPTVFDGQATARVYIDEGASADQRRELEAIMQGQKGGPMEGLAPLVTTWLPTEMVKIEVEEAEGTLTATVDPFGQIISQKLKNATGQQMTMQNVGFAIAFQFDNLTGALAPSGGTRWADPDLPYVIESRSGVVGAFRWHAS